MAGSPPTFGIMILQDAPWPVLLERARRAEAMGFDTIWVGDHFVNPYAPKADWFDGFTLLAALAASTSTIRLGPLVASVTLRQPALLARAAMTIDHVSSGRLELGIGAAGAPLDYSMLGLPVAPPPERVDRLQEALQIAIPLLEQGVVHHAGRFHSIDEAILAPLPVQRPRPPITVAALGPRAIELAARYGDAWNTYGVAAGRAITGRLDHAGALAATATRARQADAACEALGRDPATLRRSYLSFRGITEPLGSPSDFAAWAADFHALGFRELIVYWPQSADGEAELEAIARQVLPDLRPDLLPDLRAG